MNQTYSWPLRGLPARAAVRFPRQLARAGVAVLLLPWAALAQAPAGAGLPGTAGRPAAAPTPGPRLANLPPPNPYGRATLTTHVVASASHTYGYEVLADGRVLVRQPSIPGRPGLLGFATAAEARRVAALVAAKVRANELPPTVTEADLRRLHAGQ